MNLLEIVLRFGEKHFADKNLKNDTAEDVFLHQIHPKQIVTRLDNKPFNFYEVTYKYTTVRGNRKEGTKYFIFNSFNPQIDMKLELEKYIKEFNRENPQRQLLNVKLLKSKCLGYATLNA